MKLFTGGPRDTPQVTAARAELGRAQALARSNPHMPGLAGYAKAAEHTLSQAEIAAAFYDDDDGYNGGGYLLGGEE